MGGDRTSGHFTQVFMAVAGMLATTNLIPEFLITVFTFRIGHMIIVFSNDNENGFASYMSLDSQK